jgi:hypothetical protein
MNESDTCDLCLPFAQGRIDYEHGRLVQCGRCGVHFFRIRLDQEIWREVEDQEVPTLMKEFDLVVLEPDTVADAYKPLPPMPEPIPAFACP